MAALICRQLSRASAFNRLQRNSTQASRVILLNERSSGAAIVNVINCSGRRMTTSSSGKTDDDWRDRYRVAQEKIDTSIDELHQLSRAIWNNPELKYQEHFAHKTLTNFLKKEGFHVECNFTLETAFKATYGSDNGPNVCLICEYDALPGIGHACGHNLIAECGIAAGIAVKAGLQVNDGKYGKVTVIGTPAEEGGAGKVRMLEAKAFDGVDVAMMVHPKSFTFIAPRPLAMQIMDVSFQGKAAHASAFPWDGTNALDAAVMCYQGISVMRQQMKPTWRTHSVITNGGQSANIIPELTEMQIFVRAPRKEELEELKVKVESCIKGAATATGCEVNVEYKPAYLNLLTNSKLAEIYQRHGESLGIKFSSDDRLATLFGSTDMGNLSHEVPCIHPLYDINTDQPNHSRGFTEATGAAAAQKPTLDQAKALALTALQILKPGNGHILQSIQDEFKETVK